MATKPRLYNNSRSVLFPKRFVPLHAMISSCGFQCVESPAYNWHGEKRGEEAFTLFQYTLSGEGALEYEGERHTVRSGEALVLHIPHRHRYWWPQGGRPWHFFYLCLYGREVLRLWPVIEKRLGPVIRPGKATVALGRKIAASGVKHGFASEFHASALAYEFLMTLGGELLNAGALREGTEPFEEVLSYCRAHLRNPIDVNEMARVAGMSRFHFSRRFKQAHGMSPGAFLANMRLQAAARWLREERWTIKEIAVRAGFRDANYFARAFRGIAGVSPGEFRRNGMF